MSDVVRGWPRGLWLRSARTGWWASIRRPRWSPSLGGHAAPASVEYVVDDAQSLASLESGSFDGATCQLALMDIPDLDATLGALCRVLRPDGWFVFVIGHPCFLGPEARPTSEGDGTPALVVRGYFDERFWRSPNPQASAGPAITTARWRPT